MEFTAMGVFATKSIESVVLSGQHGGASYLVSWLAPLLSSISTNFV